MGAGETAGEVIAEVITEVAVEVIAELSRTGSAGAAVELTAGASKLSFGGGAKVAGFATSGIVTADAFGSGAMRAAAAPPELSAAKEIVADRA
jgi:hypothetical protein